MATRKKHYKKENCSTSIRLKQTRDVFGFKMSLLGQHGFDWEIVIEEDNNKIRTIRFSKRILAVKEFNKRKDY